MSFQTLFGRGKNLLLAIVCLDFSDNFSCIIFYAYFQRCIFVVMIYLYAIINALIKINENVHLMFIKRSFKADNDK